MLNINLDNIYGVMLLVWLAFLGQCYALGTWHEEGFSSMTSPWYLSSKSNHWSTLPIPMLHALDMRSISSWGTMKSHKFIPLILPTKLSEYWNPLGSPGAKFWSWPIITTPPPLITWPAWKLLPESMITPSTINFQDPFLFAQRMQTWCHIPS